MQLLLIRHADALPVDSVTVHADAERPLSDQGQAQAAALGRLLRDADVRVEKLFTSPLLRAEQTAKGVLNEWGVDRAPLEICPALAAGTRRKKLTRFLRTLEGAAYGLVGHEPDLSDYASWLIGSRKARVDLPKAGIACIELDVELSKGAGTLRWLLTPQWFGSSKPLARGP